MIDYYCRFNNLVVLIAALWEKRRPTIRDRGRAGGGGGEVGHKEKTSWRRGGKMRVQKLDS